MNVCEYIYIYTHKNIYIYFYLNIYIYYIILYYVILYYIVLYYIILYFILFYLKQIYIYIYNMYILCTPLYPIEASHQSHFVVKSHFFDHDLDGECGRHYEPSHWDRTRSVPRVDDVEPGLRSPQREDFSSPKTRGPRRWKRRGLISAVGEGSWTGSSRSNSNTKKT